MADAKRNPTSVDGTDEPHGADKTRQERASTVEVGPPPNIIEPDPELTPEEAEEARKRYLLKRFWISARRYWGSSGDKLAWPFSIGLLAMICMNVGFQYGINRWNRGSSTP